MAILSGDVLFEAPNVLGIPGLVYNFCKMLPQVMPRSFGQLEVG